MHLYNSCVMSPFMIPLQIRAANLSGDCALMQEVLRGNLSLQPAAWGWGPGGWQERCVRRRAALSVAMNSACKGPQVWAEVHGRVDTPVWSCSV